MLRLFHQALCPHSRFVRLALGEYGIDVRLVEERVWERRQEFLALNPAGTTPVLIEEGAPPVPDAQIIAEYLDETRGAELGEHRLLPRDFAGRVEVRRLTSWFHGKFFAEVSGPLVTERVFKRRLTLEQVAVAGYRRHSCGALQYPLSSCLCRLAHPHPRLAGRRAADIRGSRRGRASVIGRLSGRCAVERRRRREGLVRAVKSRPSFRPAARRGARRDPTVEDLRRSRFLSEPTQLRAALEQAARDHGFDAVGITKPDAAPEASTAYRFLAEGAHGDMAWMAETQRDEANRARCGPRCVRSSCSA